MATTPSPTSNAQVWGEEREIDVIYSIALKRVRYYSDLKAAEKSTEPVARLQWRTCKIRALKAGSLEKLVDNLAIGDEEVDSSYMQTFLCTFRGFTDASIVFSMLADRFRSAGEEKSEMRDQIRRNVFSVLKVWVELYPYDFISPTDSLMKSLAKFVETVKGVSGIKIKLDKLKSAARAKSVTAKSPVAKSSYMEFGYHLMKLSSRVIAEQLTILDADLFCGVIPYHCMGCFWGKRNKAERAPSVYKTVDHFNHISMLVTTSILLAKNADKAHTQYREATARAKVTEKWIEVGSECRKVKNFSSLKSILSGLQSSPIYRLKKTWACVQKDIKDVFDELSSLFSQDKNQEKTRELLMREGTAKYSQGGKPTRRQRSHGGGGVVHGVVPYLGIFLTDLMMIDTAHPNHVEGGLVNFDKRKKEFEILAQLVLFQKSASIYKFKPEKSFLECLKNAERLTERECYKLSCKVEPGPEVDPTSPNRPLSLSRKIKNFFGSKGDLSGNPTEFASSPTKDSSTLTVPSSFMRPSTSATDLQSLGNSEHRKLRKRTPSFSEVSGALAIKVALNDPTDVFCVYKSILLTRNATTESLISSALERHGIHDDPFNYRLIQITEANKRNVIPEKVSAFFFIDTDGSELKFILERSTHYSLERSTKSSTISLTAVSEVAAPLKVSWKQFELLHSNPIGLLTRESSSVRTSRSSYELGHGNASKPTAVESLFAPSLNSCVVKVGVDVTDKQPCVYKSMLLTSGDHTDSVIRSAMDKFGLTGSPSLFCLMYSPNNKKFVPIPDGSNVFYAIDRSSSSVRLILRDRDLLVESKSSSKHSGKAKKVEKRKPVSSSTSPGLEIPLFARRQMSLSLTGMTPSKSLTIDCIANLEGSYTSLKTSPTNRIIRVGVKSPAERACLYKSLLLSDGDHTNDVIASAIGKLEVDGSARDYSLFQVVDAKSWVLLSWLLLFAELFVFVEGTLLEIPSGANVFYAMDSTLEDSKFVLQMKES
eukprot:m.18153 g.18153  ORF g.18153 m.18153 type:complete len:994 (+) comp27607_c0_seq2:95-3076(+)